MDDELSGIERCLQLPIADKIYKKIYIFQQNIYIFLYLKLGNKDFKTNSCCNILLGKNVIDTN